MKTFFTILITVTILIASTVIYVVNDTSKIVFDPDSMSENINLEKKPGASSSVQDSSTEHNSRKKQQDLRESGNLEVKAPGNGRDSVMTEHTRQKQQATVNLSAESTSENGDQEQIQKEIRELRNDTNRILEEILNN